MLCCTMEKGLTQAAIPIHKYAGQMYEISYNEI